MIRWANRKEVMAWLRANAQGPTCFCMWGHIYVQRAIWDGVRWRWLTDEEQQKAAGVQR